MYCTKISAETPSSNLGVIAPWVRTPKMWFSATTLAKSAQAVQFNNDVIKRDTLLAPLQDTATFRMPRHQLSTQLAAQHSQARAAVV